MVGYVYPLLGIFWSMLIFFLWVAWFMLLFRIIGDIFRSADLGGLAKTLWIIFVIFLPFLGVLVYCIARGGSMAERTYADASARQASFDSYVRETAGSASSADQIAKFAALRDQGVITEAEFAAQNAQLLA
jgi:Phospholipase_D-nuclease N-terminal